MADRWHHNFLWGRAMTISGGASEIIRGLVGRQLLGLPEVMSDEEQIRDLLARYCLTLDLDDVDGWVALFTPDATYQVYGRAFEGHEGLGRMMGGAPGGLHLGGPPVIERVDDDHATHAAEPAVRRAGVGRRCAAPSTTTSWSAPPTGGGSRRPGAASSWPGASRTARPNERPRASRTVHIRMSHRDSNRSWNLRTVPPELVERYTAEGWWTDETLGGTVAGAVGRLADAELVVHSKVRPWRGTFGEVDRAARSFAASLQARGIGPGDVVVFQLPNWVEAAITFWGAAQLGAVVVPIVHFYGPKEVGYVLDVVQPDAVVTAGPLRADRLPRRPTRRCSRPRRHALVRGRCRGRDPARCTPAPSPSCSTPSRSRRRCRPTRTRRRSSASRRGRPGTPRA